MRTLDWPLMVNNIPREDIDLLRDYLADDVMLTQSRQVREFEREWSEWLGVKHSLFVNSGSSANLLTMAALKELYGAHKVVVPPLTWVSDVASVLQAGHTPVFADIDMRTLGAACDEIVARLDPAVKTVFLTHILGYNALSDWLLDELGSRGIRLIEDVCESHGATHKGRKLGSIGYASNFSFYYAHHMSTIEGGMISTNDSEFYDTIRMLRSHGMVREAAFDETKARYAADYSDLNPEFIFAYPAYNVRSTEINAYLGRLQLKKLDRNNVRRVENLRLFLSALDPEKYLTDFDQAGNSNYAFTLVLRKPDETLMSSVCELLRSHNVEFRRGTSGGGNQLRQPYLRRLFGELYREYPNTDHIHFYGLYLGNYPSLDTSKIETLCKSLNSLSGS